MASRNHGNPLLTISTAGTCLPAPSVAIGWAWVDHQRGYDLGGAASGTAQIANLTAMSQAIGAHPGELPLLIETDSQFAVRCANDWRAGWRRRDWRTATGSPVPNIELMKLLDAAITDRVGPVRFHWVRGHVDHPYLERARRLANQAAQDWANGHIAAWNSGRLF